MATYEELKSVESNDTIRMRVGVAVNIKAHSILTTATPTAEQIEWARAALNDPDTLIDTMLRFILAANEASDLATILAVTDATIQTQVDAAADILKG